MLAGGYIFDWEVKTTQCQERKGWGSALRIKQKNKRRDLLNQTRICFPGSYHRKYTLSWGCFKNYHLYFLFGFWSFELTSLVSKAGLMLWEFSIIHCCCFHFQILYVLHYTFGLLPYLSVPLAHVYPL